MGKTRKRRNTGRVTLQDVAKYAGVGSMTVSRTLRTPEMVSDKLREKIEQAIQELGYIPNGAAGVLASGQSNIIAVLVPSLTDKACATFIQSLQQVLNKHSFQVLLGCHEYNRNKEAEIIMTLLQSNAAALIIFGSQLTDKAYNNISHINIPIINVAGSHQQQTTINIETDFSEAAYTLTEYMLNKGRKHIGYIGAQMDNRLLNQQINGWNKAMLHHYQNADQNITTPDAASMQFGRQAITEMLLRQPELEGVVCSHEVIALGVMFECQRRLLKIPADLAVACLEGSDNCDHTQPTLTSIRIDYPKIGKDTGKLLVRLLNKQNADEPECQNNQHHLFSYKFEPRQST
ncbi:LacI family DNA-binding transcriptional regulator [Photorhabdus heterorhabditis]|uniref:LacI family DNA-binding transcriptional regulator n=1 Tax=Photorhabdus heterorhabditis TaxID=880156 RepID=A0A5B0W3A8_9GAMM|nr:LacI family DNA-binding transcriptional regulator [Photorhabdus heterorhabditis]KAA1181304.1 LacI family DNA-binding transcriptional regulator [Photorhabdus heterorhabditis]KOY60297.1 LacI family transcriptional regulator [Photorhabdus heterorhabditis]MBS9444036.1 LacI family DNA-binding transcriptional regulator [Photorhabdus heterorhabditis]